MVLVTLKHLFWASLKRLMLHLILSNNNALSIKKTPIIGYLNINSSRNPFTDFKKLILNETDVFLISESKLHNTFSYAQFKDGGCRLSRKDRNKFKGGIILFVKRNIPCKIINSHKFPAGIEIICFEFSICYNKSFLLGTCKSLLAVR